VKTAKRSNKPNVAGDAARRDRDVFARQIVQFLAIAEIRRVFSANRMVSTANLSALLTFTHEHRAFVIAASQFLAVAVI
jgi:hypothetical protein